MIESQVQKVFQSKEHDEMIRIKKKLLFISKFCNDVVSVHDFPDLESRQSFPSLASSKGYESRGLKNKPCLSSMQTSCNDSCHNYSIYKLNLNMIIVVVIWSSFYFCPCKKK